MAIDSDDKLSENYSTLKIEIMEMQTCPKCHSARLMRDDENVEIVCMDCGFVADQKSIGEWSEQKVFDEKPKKKRVKLNVPLTFTIHDKGLTTVVDWHARNTRSEKPLVAHTQMCRLRKWQRRIRVTGSTEHNLTYAMSEITKVVNKLSLPKNIVEISSIIYQKAVKDQITNGRSIRDIAIATLYLACRQSGLPITLDEFTHASATSKKEIGRNYRFLIKKFDCSIPPLRPNQCITKFSNKIATQRKIEKITHKILTAAKDSNLTAGRSPTSIAAAASYIALILVGEPKTQKEIADATQITEVTIKNRYKELVSQLMYEISL